MRHSPDVALMLGHSRRWWANISAASGECLVVVGLTIGYYNISSLCFRIVNKQAHCDNIFLYIDFKVCSDIYVRECHVK